MAGPAAYHNQHTLFYCSIEFSLHSSLQEKKLLIPSLQTKLFIIAIGDFILLIFCFYEPDYLWFAFSGICGYTVMAILRPSIIR